MPWSAPAEPSWNVTDQDLLSESAYHLLENDGVQAGITYGTVQFTTAQFIAALNDRQRRFIRDTGIVTAQVTNGVTAGSPRYALPQDLIDIRRLTYQPIAGNISPLVRVDEWELDTGMLDWQYNQADPTTYHVSTLPTLQVEVAKAPANGGTLGMLYVMLGNTLDGTGVKLTVPDEFAPFVYYGALADMFNMDGEGQDLARAAFCGQMYDLGVELAKQLVGGPRATA